jgi:GYF domain 2
VTDDEEQYLPQCDRRARERKMSRGVMTDGWHYVEGERTVGPIDLREMQIVLSKISDPRNLWVWKIGFKDWERAGNVQELAEFIYNPPPPLPQMTHRWPWTSQGMWRSAVFIIIAVALQWAFLIEGSILGAPWPFVIGAMFAAPLILIALDWATRRRRQFAARVR